ncbi:MAG: sugar phosphorylase [Planctomycetota bacterium]
MDAAPQSSSPNPQPPPTLVDRIAKHLSAIYENADHTELARRLILAFDPDASGESSAAWNLPAERPAPTRYRESDILLLTYADSICSEGQPPLKTFKQFIDQWVGDAVSTIHLLPFFPYSSDDGFAVVDYEHVRRDLGSWDEIEALAQSHELMFDIVVNHVSSKHAWFQQFLSGEEPGKDYFLTVNPQTNLSDVVRPRTNPLLRPTPTPQGLAHVWCTFSHDQVDLNFSNPDVLVEMVGVVGRYVRHGASILRLDAIAYLWKQIGTSCIHLPQTHEIVRLMRTLLDHLSPGTRLITETNVPNNENLSYFGNRNEAHIIYNFSLAPLIVHALLSGQSQYLQRWMRGMPPAPVGCTYLNFTASHDGIGMRPAEGLLDDSEQQRVVDAIRSFGGLISTRQMPDGSERIYELNISFFDALKGTFSGTDSLQVERFLCSQTIAMGIEGIPAIYIHSLLATHNDFDGVRKTGRNRTINRHRWDHADLMGRLNDPQSDTARVHSELIRRLRIRRNQPAFSPDATQFTLILENHFFGFWRQSTDRRQSVFAVHNLTGQIQSLSLEDLNLTSTDQWFDLIGGTTMPGMYESIDVQPYGCLWISNHDGVEP